MQTITKLILLLTILSLALLSACGGQPSTEAGTRPNADHLVKFDENGVATVRGQITGGGITYNDVTLTLEIPVKVEGVNATVAAHFNVRPKTEISSSQTPLTTAGEYSAQHDGRSAYDAFPPTAWVEITFRKQGTQFEAISVREINWLLRFIQYRPAIENVFSIEGLLQEGILGGDITQSHIKADGTISWGQVSVPIEMQGVKATVELRVDFTANTQIVTAQEAGIDTARSAWGTVQIIVTRNFGKLYARRVIQLR